MLPGGSTVRVQESKTGGRRRGPNPPSAACAPIISFNFTLWYSPGYKDTPPNQKTRRNGFTSHISRTTLNTALRRSRSRTRVSGSIMTTSENRGDVTVENRSLRKPSSSTECWMLPVELIMISRDRSDLLFDRSKACSGDS